MILRAFGTGAVAASAMAIAIAMMWATSGTQRERPLLTTAASDLVRTYEVTAAAHPRDARTLRFLAQAYLDAQQPGLAVAWLEASPVAVRGEPADVDALHLYARALLDEGRNDDALAVEERVVSECVAVAEATHRAPGCDAVVLASAVRRSAILKELLAMGIEDTGAHPEASLVAYQNATREARVDPL